LLLLFFLTTIDLKFKSSSQSVFFVISNIFLISKFTKRKDFFVNVNRIDDLMMRESEGQKGRAKEGKRTEGRQKINKKQS